MKNVFTITPEEKRDLDSIKDILLSLRFTYEERVDPKIHTVSDYELSK